MPELLELTNGAYALVDAEDLPVLSQYRWRAQYRYSSGKKGAPSAVVTGNARKGTFQTMHRFLMGAGPGQIVDHVNGVPLNNTRANLRFCTHEQNMRNRRRAASNRCGHKGVYQDVKTPGKGRCWRAEIKVAGQKMRLGSFRTKEAAANAYAQAAKKYHGEFARTA